MAVVTAGSGPNFPVYAGPSLPRWQPRTIDDVKMAIQDGTLQENHWIDAKALVGDTPSKRKETACDLASFANEGGILIIGVAEDKQAQKLWVDPIGLTGQAERIDSIARSACDPPLFTICHPLHDEPAEDGRPRGVLVVEIPPSPLAPHMVDGRYYGRSDTTKSQLKDSEVARLHAVRAARQWTAQELIAAEIERDPIPAGERRFSHLYVVARPLASPPDLLTARINDGSIASHVSGPGFGVPAYDQCEPNWNYLNKTEPRARGIGFASHGVFGRRPDPTLEVAEESVLDLEVGDDALVTLFCGRGSFVTSGRGQDWPVLNDKAVATLTRTVVTIAGSMGSVGGYAGRWILAVGVTDTAGKCAGGRQPGYSNWVPFSDDSYIQGTEATTVELKTQPGAVTTRLLARLMRGLSAAPSAALFDN